MSSAMKSNVICKFAKANLNIIFDHPDLSKISNYIQYENKIIFRNKLTNQKLLNYILGQNNIVIEK